MQKLNDGALETIIRGSGLTFRQSAVSWIFDCPKCSKREKLFIRKRDGRFICWFCATVNGFQGRPEIALRELLGVPLARLREQLYGVAEDNGVDLDLPDIHWDIFSEDERPQDTPALVEVAFPHDFFEIGHRHATKGRTYLEGRGISVAMATAAGLRYHPEERRVVFPVVVAGMLVGWQARLIEPDVSYSETLGREVRVAKILTSGKFPRDTILMGQDELRGASTAILVEGPVDRLKCHLCGPAVASMGKSVSQGQIDVLLASGISRLYVGIDPDAAAEVERLCLRLAGLEIYRLLPSPGADDLGDMSPEAVLRRYRTAPQVNAAHLFLPPQEDFYARYREGC